MISDITEYPYYCDDCNSWHMLLFELDDAGTLHEGDTDGNWEIAYRDTMPTDDECRSQFESYGAWVAANGTDPLNQYNVKYNQKVKTVWTFRFIPSILGVLVQSARAEHGKAIRPMDLKKSAPAYVLDYLNLREDMARPVLSDVATMAELRAVQTLKRRRGEYLKVELEHDKPRPAAEVRAELISKAR